MLIKELIKIPFITPDGVSYEGEALKEHCNQMGHFDPVTRNSLYLAPLLKNEALEEAVQDFLEKKPWVFDSEFNLDYKKVLL